MSATAARQASLRALRAVRAGELSDRALRREVDPLEGRDRAWARELVLGTLRFRGRLDHLLAAHTRRPLDSLDPDILDVLRMGAFQLTGMDGVPPWAAVSQSVELAKSRNERASGLVNAVLQAIRRSDGSIEWPDPETDPVRWLATWGSHPSWLVERWLHRFGPDAAGRLVEANNSRAPLYLRPVGIEAEEAIPRLAGAGIAVSREERVPELLLLEKPADVGRALEIVPAIVQDPAAALVARFVSAPPASVIYDACAAPGGKTIALAGGTGRASGGIVVAGDASRRRIATLIENVERVRPPGVLVHVADARRPAIRTADVVFVDAPCTGTGTLRRHVDGRWRVGPDDLAALTAIQTQILEGVAETVRPGGLLVYATCSIENEENDDRIAGFLDRHPGFRLEPPAGFDAMGLDDGKLRVLPHEHGWDGAFAARLRRED